MSFFSHNYIVSDEFFFDAKTLCMRCGVVIMDKTYMEMPAHNDLSKKVNVAIPHPLSHYRLVPVIGEMNGRASMYHLPMCRDCEKVFELTDSEKELIIKQITNATVAEAKWSGYAQIFIDATIGRMAQTRLLRKAEPRDLKGD